VLLERHVQRKVVKPPRIIAAKRFKLSVRSRKAAPGGYTQDRHAVFPQRIVIYSFGIAAPFYRVDLAFRQQSVLDEHVKVYKIRVSRKTRKALIRRVAVARRAERQELPVFLPCGGEKVGKVIGGLAHRADAVGRGKGGDRHQNAGGSFDQWNHFFRGKIGINP